MLMIAEGSIFLFPVAADSTNRKNQPVISQIKPKGTILPKFRLVFADNIFLQ